LLDSLLQENLKKGEGIYRLRWVPEGACPS